MVQPHVPMSSVPLPGQLITLPSFDPRTVPVTAVGNELPSVVPALLQGDGLRRRFRLPPVWSPELVSEPRMVARDPVHASVLVPIVLRDRPTVLLTQRTAHLATHSGQIAFPGGKADPDDEHAIGTALREAREEVGLEADFVEVLGVLPHYLTGSAFIITPVVALVHDGFSVAPNPQEVDDVFEVPLEFLMNPANHRRHSWEPEPGVRREWFSMPYHDGASERFIWGATAGMLRNFYRFLSA